MNKFPENILAFHGELKRTFRLWLLTGSVVFAVAGVL